MDLAPAAPAEKAEGDEEESEDAEGTEEEAVDTGPDPEEAARRFASLAKLPGELAGRTSRSWAPRIRRR